MNFRKLAFLGLGGIVLTGSWYYREELAQLTGIALSSPSSTSAQPSSAAGSASTPTPEGVRIVAIDHGSLYTGTLPPHTPISQEQQAGRKVLAMLSSDEATAKLRRNEESYNVNRGRGVFRYDVVQIPSNEPIEDDHAEKIIEVPNTVAVSDEAHSDWMFWGVFDGHSGWTTSAKLRQTLIGYVAHELNAIYKSAIADPALKSPAAETIDNAIKQAFLKLDKEIVIDSVEKVFKNPSKAVAAEILAPAISGSCALLAFYESRSQMLRVAVTGDSRAVLGRRGKNGKWTATALSEDQTAGTPSETKRLRAEHPGEHDVVHRGRVFGGLEPSRAFGDASYKWTVEVQKKIKDQFLGRRVNMHIKTPPYVTAEPVVTTTKIEPENGDFVVMATDGLWEMLTNEEVVGLVGQWIEEQKGAKSKGWLGGWFGGASKKEVLPVEKSDENGEKAGKDLPDGFRTGQWGVNKQDERFVFQDKNVATHIARNALGGKNQDMLCALLTLPSPFSRRYRDDLTVEVIFFGEGDKSGNVTINEEATAQQPQADIKPKL